MDLKLKGKTALVCAASKGLGLAIAQSLAREGVHLYLCARDEQTLAKAAHQLRSEQQATVHYQAVDLARPENIAPLAAAARAALGPIDILVNNVGGPAPSAAMNTNLSQWQQGFEQIFLSSTLLSQALLPDMRERRFGRIISITSLSVVEPIEHLVVSTAMRAAVTTFAKTLSTETAPYGITVNTVMPGVIHTERIERLREAKASRDGTTLQEEMQKSEKLVPMGRLGRPEELADLVTFLASAKASYLTGLNLAVDGGLRRGW